MNASRRYWYIQGPVAGLIIVAAVAWWATVMTAIGIRHVLRGGRP